MVFMNKTLVGNEIKIKIKNMKINKIISLFVVLLTFVITSCDPIVDEIDLTNTTNVDGVELVATQSTVGGNEITLNMVTPGITGYWDYNLGLAKTNKVTFIYPIPGTSTFTFTGTLGKEFFDKTIDVQIDQLDQALDQDWYDLVSDNTSTGKTWVFDGVGGDGGLWSYMSPPNDPGSWATAWWNAGGTCCPPSDVDGKMKFDLDGAANFTYHSGATASPEVGNFVLDVANQTLVISGSDVLGGNDYGPTNNTYTIIELTEDKMILYVPNSESQGTGWTFVYVPAV